jgi:hypothetical protein
MRYYHGDSAIATHIGSYQDRTGNVQFGAWCELHAGLERTEIVFTRQANYAATLCLACPSDRASNRRASLNQQAFIGSLVRSYGKDAALAVLAVAFPGENIRYILNAPNAEEASTIIGLLKREAK